MPLKQSAFEFHSWLITPSLLPHFLAHLKSGKLWIPLIYDILFALLLLQHLNLIRTSWVLIIQYKIFLSFASKRILICEYFSIMVSTGLISLCRIFLETELFLQFLIFILALILSHFGIISLVNNNNYKNNQSVY